MTEEKEDLDIVILVEETVLQRKKIKCLLQQNEKDPVYYFL